MNAPFPRRPVDEEAAEAANRPVGVRPPEGDSLPPASEQKPGPDRDEKVPAERETGTGPTPTTRSNLWALSKESVGLPAHFLLENIPELNPNENEHNKMVQNEMVVFSKYHF